MTTGPIKQRLISGVPGQGVIQPGQLFVDEAAQIAWTAGLNQPLAIPLGRQAFPDASGEAGEVLIQTDTGLAYGVLSAGGGGLPQTTTDWLVPGVTPRAVEDLLVSVSHEFLIELTLPATLSEARATFAAGPTVSVAVSDLASVAQGAFDLTSGTALPAILLSAGTYLVEITVTAPTTFRAIAGNLRNRPEALHPVFFKIEVV